MRKVGQLWGASHPGPTLVVTVLALALGLAAGLDVGRLAVLVVAVFCGQLSVGLSNDAIDAERDRAVGRADKPLVDGSVSPGAALAAAVGALVIALALSAPLGSGLVAAHAIALASAWAYNAGLKSTVVSIMPFVVSFGLFPSFATLAHPDPALAPGWAAVAGGVLGAAVHLTNVLPDLDDDRKTGVRGLPHRLGARGSAEIAAAGILLGVASVLWGSVRGVLANVPPPAWALAALAAVAALTTGILALARPPGRTLFRLVELAALLLAAQLVTTGALVA